MLLLFISGLRFKVILVGLLGPAAILILAKQSKPGREVKEFFFPSFPENIKLCPVRSLTMYIERTKVLRGDNNRLFVSFIKPHRAVTSSTIARWLKEVMAAAGIDTSTFKAHSARGASTSTASMQGVTTQDILSAADWSRVYIPKVLLEASMQFGICEISTSS